MTKLSSHQSASFVKLLYIGDSGTGKSGSLVSLVRAGYFLRILDLDNGLDALRHEVLDQCPEKIDQIDFETLRDPVKMTQAGPIVTAKAYISALKLMSEWSDGSKPSEAGADSIFVIDSLTALGKACFEWAKSMNAGAKDPRQWFYAAQQSIESVIGMFSSETFRSNVIIISHINYRDLEEGTTKGYPSAIGSALGPTLPKYFNTMIQAEIRGEGKHTKRKIRTLPSSIIDLKTPAPKRLEAEYDLNDGLAEIFRQIKAAG